jgi:hypothetical protein
MKTGMIVTILEVKMVWEQPAVLVIVAEAEQGSTVTVHSALVKLH